MANLTPGDNYLSAASRATPRVSRQFSVELTDDTPDFVQFGEDVKSAVIEADGEDLEFWPSYFDGTNDYLDSETPTEATYANAAADFRVKRCKDGRTFTEAQEAEFNRIHFVIQDDAGTATGYAFPGGGKNNGRTPG